MGFCCSWPPLLFVHVLFLCGPTWVMLSVPSFVLCVVFRSLLGFAPLGSWCFCLVLLPVRSLVLLCLCCAPFCVLLGPAVSVVFLGCCRLLSLSDVASPPPAVGPVWRPGPVFYAGTSLWVSGCSCDGLVALLYCWECGCALASFLHFVSWQQRLLALCGVCITLSTMLHVLFGCSV